MPEKWKLFWEIGQLRARCLLLRAQEALMLLKKNPVKEILGDIVKIRDERKQLEAQIAELRKKSDELGKGGAK